MYYNHSSFYQDTWQQTKECFVFIFKYLIKICSQIAWFLLCIEQFGNLSKSSVVFGFTQLYRLNSLVFSTSKNCLLKKQRNHHEFE